MKIDNNNQIKFTSRLKETEYTSYKTCKDYNGKMFDTFILSELKEIKARPEETTVFDIGAGQGRNTIPLAKEGYNIYAFEINKIGLQDLKAKRKSNKLKERIKIYKSNILYKLKTKGKVADFAFMSHISQHFTPIELEKALKNIADKLNENGTFVMDALVRKKEKYKHYDNMPCFIRFISGDKSLDSFGAASFKREDVLKAAKKAGLKLIQESPFEEKGLHRASYETHNLWGGFNIIDSLFGVQRRPVKLTWFVFKKI